MQQTIEKSIRHNEKSILPEPTIGEDFPADKASKGAPFVGFSFWASWVWTFLPGVAPPKGSWFSLINSFGGPTTSIVS